MKLIVGIGASVGDAKALEAFFRALPATSGCCFVVVQPVSPDVKSGLGDFLARQTCLPVLEVEEGMPAAPDTIFLVPPKKRLTIYEGLFHLTDCAAATVAEPINWFFESLATAAGARAVGVLLSVEGSDGAEGVRAIRNAGGLVVVQDSDTTAFESASGNDFARPAVDHTLAPADMPAVIVAYACDLEVLRSRDPYASTPVEADTEREPMVRIKGLLRRVTGIDLSEYNLATIERRIERRLALSKVPDLAAYASLLAVDPEELNALYGDVLIGVTEFFRDAAAFEILREKIAPTLLASNRPHDVRVWIAGCATGEEAYSIAIVLDEVACATGFTGRFAIFATDVHLASLEFAATGVYGAERLKNVSPARLARYFREEKPGSYRIIPEIQKRLTFAPHNLLSDPPFTNLDLVSCRNLLIDFTPALQGRVIRLFHFALRTGGCLFLGPGESPGQRDGVRFEVLEPQFKIFRTLGGPTGVRPPFSEQLGRHPALGLPAQPVQPASLSTPSRAQLLAAYDHILRQYVPDGLLINGELEILHCFGGAEYYLTPLVGRAHGSVLQRVDGELRLCLTTLVPRVFSTGESARSHDVRIVGPTGETWIDVLADPIADGSLPVALAHLSFINRRAAPPPAVAEVGLDQSYAAGRELQRRITELELELQAAKESLRTAVEERHAGNEKLHAVHEELRTANTEFERKNIELQILNDDLNNLSDSIDTAVVFVDRELRIRKCNAALQRNFRLFPQELGSPIDRASHLLADPEAMRRDLVGVLASGESVQRQVRTHDGQWLLMRVLAFRTAKGAIDGVVVTFTDINETRILQERLKLAMDSSRLVWWDWDLLLGGLAIHCGHACILGYTPAMLPATGAAWEEATHPEDLPKVRAAIQTCLDGLKNDWAQEHRLRTPDGGWRWVFNSGRVSEFDAAGKPVRMLGTTQDISDRKRIEQESRQLEKQLFQAQKMETMGMLAGGIAHDFNNIIAAILGYTELALAQAPAGDRARRMHEGVLRAAHRARDLINRILTFSRTHEPELCSVRLAEVITEVAKFIRASLPATVELELQLEAGTPSTLADANQLHQVLMNLATNAAHAMREHGGRLTLRLRVVTFTEMQPMGHAMLPPGRFLAIEVADTGHGIAPENLDKIFDPFFTTKPVGEGTGLGLSIVRSIIERHGGGVDVVSHVGTGSTFRLLLPIVAPGESQSASPGLLFSSLPRGRGERVAVIDDELDVGQVVTDVLRGLGYEVRRYSSADEFLTVLSVDPAKVDLVVTDHTMPHMTGLDLARQLRASNLTMPILLVSGLSRDLAAVSFANLEPIQLLGKPFDLEQIALFVDRLLHPPSRSQGAPPS